MTQRNRPDRDGKHKHEFDRNREYIFKTQEICGICGKPVDMSLKFPHPLSKCVDHIMPVAHGGHPSAIENLQLAHLTCNRAKSDKIVTETKDTKKEVVTNRNLPHHIDWIAYGSNKV